MNALHKRLLDDRCLEYSIAIAVELPPINTPPYHPRKPQKPSFRFNDQMYFQERAIAILAQVCIIGTACRIYIDRPLRILAERDNLYCKSGTQTEFSILAKGIDTNKIRSVSLAKRQNWHSINDTEAVMHNLSESFAYWRI